MTQSPNPNNNNRRRRLTADELIAILVAMSGIGGIFWWTISHRAPNQSFFQADASKSANVRNTFPLTDNSANLQPSSNSKFVAAPVAPNHSAVVTTAPNTGEVDSSRSTAEPMVTPTVMEPPVMNKPTAGNTAIVPVPVPSFTDVPAKYWGKDQISTLQSMGILQDFGGGTFDPNLPVTRGEYAKMLDRAFDRPVTQQVLEFKDIPSNYPRREALDKSVKMGFMTGYPKALFKPDEQIPRYQLQISLAKGMGLKLPVSADDVLAKYGDASKMPSYARAKMAAAIESGLIMQDDQTKLQPNKPTTRGEAAALIYEALVKDGKIKPSK